VKLDGGTSYEEVVQFRNDCVAKVTGASASRTWEVTCEELRFWVLDEKRLPSRKSPDKIEASLAQWVGTIKPEVDDGTLSCARLDQLLTVPGMDERLASWRNPSRNQRTFDERCRELSEWVSTHSDVLPKRHAADGIERRVAGFISHAQTLHRANALTQKQQVLLCSVPGMKERTASWFFVNTKPWDEQYAELSSWSAANGGRLPNKRSSDDEERRLGSFLSYTQQLHRTKKLATSQVQLLLEIPMMEHRLFSWLRLQKKLEETRRKRKRRTTPRQEDSRSAPSQKQPRVEPRLGERTFVGSSSKATPTESDDPSIDSSSSSSSSETSSESSFGDDPDVPNPGHEVARIKERAALAKVKEGDLQPLQELDAKFMNEHALSLDHELKSPDSRELLYRYLLMKRKATNWWPAVASAYFCKREASLTMTISKEWLQREVEVLVKELYLKGSFGAPSIFLDKTAVVVKTSAAELVVVDDS